MVNVYFGRESVPKDKLVLDTREWFTAFKKPEWFTDPLVVEILREVDQSEVLFEEALKDRWGRGISTEMISTGCKTLCCLRFYDGEDDRVFNASAMGDNCVKYFFEIVKDKDISVFFEHYPLTLPEYFIPDIMVFQGHILHHIYDFDDHYGDWCDKCAELRRREYERLYE